MAFLCEQSCCFACWDFIALVDSHGVKRFSIGFISLIGEMKPSVSFDNPEHCYNFIALASWASSPFQLFPPDSLVKTEFACGPTTSQLLYNNGILKILFVPKISISGNVSCTWSRVWVWAHLTRVRLAKTVMWGRPKHPPTQLIPEIGPMAVTPGKPTQ